MSNVLALTITDTDEGSRFAVHRGAHPAALEDVTADFELSPLELPDGRSGFVLLPKVSTRDEEARAPSVDGGP